MGRVKKRVIGTVLSLSISGILFLVFSTVAFSMRDSTGALAARTVQGDITVTAGKYGPKQTPDPLSRELAETIARFDGVTSIVPVVAADITHEVKAANLYAEFIVYRGGPVIGIPAEQMQKIIDKVYEGKPTLADLNVPGNVIVVMPSQKQKRAEEINRQDPGWYIFDTLAMYYVGYTLDCTIYKNQWDDHSGQGIGNVKLNIVGLVHEEDIQEYGQSSLFPPFYMPMENFAALGLDDTYENLILKVDETKQEAVYAAVTQLCEDDPDLLVQSRKQVKDELTRQITGIIAVVYLMLCVIALNGVMNLMGATFMGIEQRKKEMGVLMAIGLSHRSVGKLLTREGLWISLLCAGLSVVFGLGLGFSLYSLVVYIGADYMHFVFPVWPLVSLCIIIGIMPYTVTLLASRRLRRSTIVELLGRQT